MFFQQLLFKFLRIFFKLLYHQFAWLYDWVADFVSLGQWKEWIYSSLPYLNGEQVLELGHGPGHLQQALLNKGVFSIGIDESWQMNLKACRRLIQGGAKPLLINSYAQSLPLVSEHFDQVVATFPTEYIADPHTLSEAYRVLVPGGNLIVLPVAWITGQRWHEKFARWLFSVTKQAPDWQDRMLMPFEEAGFVAHVTRKKLRSSELLIIIARKPINP